MQELEIIPGNMNRANRQEINAFLIFPCEMLRPYVHHYWVLHTKRQKISKLILPMGCSKWMFHRKKPFIVNGHLDTSNVASVCGQYDNAIKIKSDEDMDMICVFFQPYALKFMMGIPGDVFTQNSIDFDCLENPELSLLKRHVLDADTDRESL